MKILFLWPYHPAYFEYFDLRHPEVVNMPFAAHREVILDDHCGWPGDLSRHMKKQGMDIEFIARNAEQLQKKWAEENDFTNYGRDSWEKDIAIEQIRRWQQNRAEDLYPAPQSRSRKQWLSWKELLFWPAAIRPSA